MGAIESLRNIKEAASSVSLDHLRALLSHEQGVLA